MRLGVSLGYWDAGGPADQLELAVEAERLGYAVAWAAEAYGSDAATVLAWVGARTERIGLGSAVFQIPGRSPAMTAMTAATLDTLSGGRFRLGLGVSGPQVSEGWHGVRFADPLGRTREYVDIVRKALARELVTYAGRHQTLPLPDGPGKALHLTIRAVQQPLPIYLAAVGPRNLELAGEIADGWLGLFFAPEQAGDSLAAIARGRARRSEMTSDAHPHPAPPFDPPPFDVVPTVPSVAGTDVAVCADAVRPYAALYLGGMGSRTQNFYNRQAVRMGFGDGARAVQDAYLDGRPRDAASLVPAALLDATSLLGPRPRIAERLATYAAAGVTTLTVAPQGRALADRLETLRVVAAAAVDSGVVDLDQGR